MIDVDMNGYPEVRSIQLSAQNVKALIGTNLERKRKLNFLLNSSPDNATIHPNNKFYKPKFLNINIYFLDN